MNIIISCLTHWSTRQKCQRDHFPHTTQKKLIILFLNLGYNNNKLFNKNVLYKMVDEQCSTIVINNNNNHNNNKKERESEGDSSYVRL